MDGPADAPQVAAGPGGMPCSSLSRATSLTREVLSFSPLELSMSTTTGALPENKKGKSCAECKRSKLKCDRGVPCQSCIRRGCAAICPSGSLTAMRGNQALMTQSQQLTEQVKTMSKRINELEAALKKQQGVSLAPQPLLRDAGRQNPLADASDLQVKYEADLECVSVNLGSLTIGCDGNTKYHGETVDAEYLKKPAADGAIASKEIRNPKRLGLPVDILELVESFPLGPYQHPHSTVMFVPFLPSRERAIRLVDLYYEHMAWVTDPIPRGDFERNILKPIYQTLDGRTCLSTIHAHNLSVFFMVLAIGSVFDDWPSRELLTEQYHALGRAAFALESIVRGATCAGSQALFLMLHYLYHDRSGNERRWMLMGVCAKMSHMIGIHRDSAGWNPDREDVQRRRTIFWELYTWDAWTSVAYGRPPALNLGHSDCRFPDDLNPFIKEDGSSELGYQAWKLRFSAACTSIAVQLAFTVQPLDYMCLLDLDKRIRTFPIPSHLRRPKQDAQKTLNQDISRVMQQGAVVSLRETILLYIHRSYLTQALLEATDPLQHKYSPSVIAAYRSSLALIANIKVLNVTHPKFTSRRRYFWSGLYMCCVSAFPVHVLLGAIVAESPGCMLSQNALAEFDSARAIYEEASPLCYPPATRSIVDKLHVRAHAAFEEYQAKQHNGKTSWPMSMEGGPGAPNKLNVLAGSRTTIINNSASVSLHSSPEPSAHGGDVRQGSGSAETDLLHMRSAVVAEPGLQSAAGASGNPLAPELPTHGTPTSDAYNADPPSAYAAFFNPPTSAPAYGYTLADPSQPANETMQATMEEPLSLYLPGLAAFTAVQPQSNFHHTDRPPVSEGSAASSLSVHNREMWQKLIENLGMSPFS
ncbi:hypothetical protein FA95DRAFT_1598877 [Auriscalpium vulgare]|uniref:Uncharacterized protein n=1 Tax=Auriscalpium vulgare TaxID=40419 RepID=A0ACB8RCD1_9AGAM|nr:hypothetical protein FA95DRAFT_1598877 [Auriscalpium vulgare]